MIHTQFENLTDAQLADLFHSAYWGRLSGAHRAAACQELANRDALSHGMIPREVEAEDMRGLCFGAYDPKDGKIHLNRHVLERGEVVDEQGHAREYPGSNAETLDTVFHENRHAYDDQLSQAVEDRQYGMVYNRQIIEDAEARGIDIDAVRASQAIYVSNGMNSDVYRVQTCERGAYEAGEQGTARCFESSQSRLGEDEGYTAYRERLEYNDSYGESLSNLAFVYGDREFDRTLDEQTQDLFYGEHRQDNEFQYGTPESRGEARDLISNTRGGRNIQQMEAYGYVNARYQSDADARTARDGAEDSQAGGAYMAKNGAEDADTAAQVDAAEGSDAAAQADAMEDADAAAQVDAAESSDAAAQADAMEDADTAAQVDTAEDAEAAVQADAAEGSDTAAQVDAMEDADTAAQVDVTEDADVAAQAGAAEDADAATQAGAAEESAAGDGDSDVGSDSDADINADS